MDSCGATADAPALMRGCLWTQQHGNIADTPQDTRRDRSSVEKDSRHFGSSLKKAFKKGYREGWRVLILGSYLATGSVLDFERQTGC